MNKLLLINAITILFISFALLMTCINVKRLEQRVTALENIVYSHKWKPL